MLFLPDTQKGTCFFDVDMPVSNPNDCSAGNQKTIGFDPNRGNIDHVLALLLYAQAAGKSIDIQVYNQSCLSNRIVIRRIKVRD